MIQRILENQREHALAPTRRRSRKQSHSSASSLLPQVHAQLLELAQTRIQDFPETSVHESQSLLNEAFTRISASGQHFAGAAHLFFAVARSMHEIEHEEVTRCRGLERGGLRERVSQEAMEEHPGPHDPGQEIMMVDEAVMKLKRNDPANARVVVLRYFNGLTAEETAEVLGISLATVERKWRRLKAWLHKELV